jgi:hypothetical protein
MCGAEVRGKLLRGLADDLQAADEARRSVSLARNPSTETPWLAVAR